MARALSFSKSRHRERSDAALKKALVFCIVMNFIAAIVLMGQGALEMNNLQTSIPAVLCILAGLWGIVQIEKKQR